MASQSEVLEAALNELRKRREQLDRTIEGLEAELGISAVTHTTASITPEVKPFNVRGGEGSDLLRSVYEGQFFGKSQTQAAKDLLNMAHRPVKTPVISEALNKSGMKVVAPSLYTAFKRHPDFVLVLPNTWGLKEWYPEGVRSVNMEKRPKRRERKKRATKPTPVSEVQKSSDQNEPKKRGRPKKITEGVP